MPKKKTTRKAPVAKRAGKAVSKVATKAKKAVKPRNVQQTATRARKVGENVVAAGELIKQTADLVDAIATRVKARRAKRAATSQQKAPASRKKR